MTEENKAKVRAVLADSKERWNRYGQIEPNPSPLIWDKEVEIIYEDMDGYPCICKAIYEHQSFGYAYFRATDGPAQGNRMSGVIAWRTLENETQKE